MFVCVCSPRREHLLDIWPPVRVRIISSTHNLPLPLSFRCVPCKGVCARTRATSRQVDESVLVQPREVNILLASVFSTTVSSMLDTDDDIKNGDFCFICCKLEILC